MASFGIRALGGWSMLSPRSSGDWAVSVSAGIFDRPRRVEALGHGFPDDATAGPSGELHWKPGLDRAAAAQKRTGIAIGDRL